MKISWSFFLYINYYNFFFSGWKNDTNIFNKEYFENILGTKNKPLINNSPFCFYLNKIILYLYFIFIDLKVVINVHLGFYIKYKKIKKAQRN